MKSESKIVSIFYSLFINVRELSFITYIERVVTKLKPAEKLVFSICSIIFVITSITLIYRVNSAYLVEIPTFGGHFSEGLLGSPRFLNPILAISDTDKDLSSVIYSGLLKKDENGLVNDLAESFSVSEDGRVYSFLIKENAKFHNGTRVTADDIVFTIEKILDPIIKSPRNASWNGVMVEKVGDREVRFILNKPYRPFLESLTVGILPKNIWQDVSAEEFPFSKWNIEPIGSGPYKISKIIKNDNEIPIQINLTSFKEYVWGKPKINNISFKFFQNREDLVKAYQDKKIHSVANIDAESAKKISSNSNLIIEETSLPRIFGLFFNQNVAPVFVHKEVREALDLATPKTRIINEVLQGFGKPLNGPTPENIETDDLKASGNVEAALTLMTKAGWSKNENGILVKKLKNETVSLSFSITTSDSPDLKNTALILKEAWEALGAKVDILIFESGDLSQNIIKGRKYDALLFGEAIGTDSDLYPFWHSSLRNDPGLNVSLYTNINADKLLTEIQSGQDEVLNLTKRNMVIKMIQEDRPTIFLFTPSLIYLKPSQVRQTWLRQVAAPSERFASVHKWYIETDKVWRIFAQDK